MTDPQYADWLDRNREGLAAYAAVGNKRRSAAIFRLPLCAIFHWLAHRALTLDGMVRVHRLFQREPGFCVEIGRRL